MENQLVGETGTEMKLGTQQGSNATGYAGKSISKKEVELDCCCVQMTIQWGANLLDSSQFVPCTTSQSCCITTNPSVALS